MIELSEEFWDSRYKNNDIGWDLGVISPPLKAYFNQILDKNLKILIPGAGNSYEAEYLFKNGFKNVFVVDLSKTALQKFKYRVPNFPTNQIINQDFFEIKDSFDLIIEQTFFCAINPALRSSYAKQINQLLNPKGKLVGLLFSVKLNEDKPPFGGSIEEYKKYFDSYFNIITMEDCYNSVESRKGRELFISMQKYN